MNVDHLDQALREGEPPPLPADRRRYPVHPLFPLPQGVEETKEIYEITFDRWDHQAERSDAPIVSALTS